MDTSGNLIALTNIGNINCAVTLTLDTDFLIATEKYYAFRGRLVSLRVLTHYGVSPKPQLPQASPYFPSLDRNVFYLN